MSTNDPNWSDDGFDSLNDGFLPHQPKSQEPITSNQAPVPPPPVSRSRASSTPRRAVLFLLLFFITAVGLVVTWVARGPEERVNKDVVVRTPTRELSKPTSPEQTVLQDSTTTSARVQNSTNAEGAKSSVSSAAADASTSTPQHTIKPSVDNGKPQQAPELAAAERTTEPAPVEKKADIPKPEKRQQPTTRSSANNGQEWCVQVFASTNADDADEWNDRLRTKNVYDSRIEIVDRQGQTWYRVRFGRYSTRQEAEQSALSMGFRNAWVNRTR